MANQTMQRALELAGYEHAHRGDEGGHSRKEGNKILAEALTWLWQDHGKKAVAVHLDQCQSRAGQWLIPGEDWQVVSLGHNRAEGLAVTADGTLYFTDVHDSEIFKVTPDGQESLFAKNTTPRWIFLMSEVFPLPGAMASVSARINYCCLHQDTLHIATRHRIYKRKIKLTGASAWQGAVKVPPTKVVA